MKVFFSALLFQFFCLLGISSPASASAVFKLHLTNEPSHLDPHLQRSSASSYLLQNLYRNIYFYDDDKGLTSDLGEGCRRESALILVCKLKKDLRWSDGSPLKAKDFLKSYHRILDPKTSSPRADLLFKIKNAPAIYKGQKKINTLGISAPDAETLRFEFEEKDPDFEYNLASFLLAPVKNTLLPGQPPAELIVNGPYKIAQWTSGQKIQLASNDFYPHGVATKRPLVEFYFINEDSVALQLYEKNELNFLRRLPTLYIPKLKKRPDFHWIPVIRFDYIGFGPALKNEPKLRQALAEALHYQELQKIFSSEGQPGCPGVPSSWLKKELCYSFDPKKAKAELPKSAQSTPLRLIYSSQGGEDHRRATEWMQAQWQKNLGLKVSLLLRENKVFLKELQENPPPLFRKGVAPDRPTCLATLETFADWSPENYIELKDTAYQEILKKLAEATSSLEQKNLCTEGIAYLMERFLLIPLGRIHFAVLAHPSFTGWKLNAMNQLDLKNLTALSSPNPSQPDTKNAPH